MHTLEVSNILQERTPWPWATLVWTTQPHKHGGLEIEWCKNTRKTRRNQSGPKPQEKNNN